MCGEVYELGSGETLLMKTYRNLRILVVDDDLFALDVVVQVLEGLGVGYVACANSGEDVISECIRTGF